MKRSIIINALPIAAAFFVLSSCQTPADKTKESAEKLEEAKKELSTAKDDAATASKKELAAAEWKTFKAETELKITQNELRISAIRAKLKESGQKAGKMTLQKIDSLEMRNKALQEKLEKYNSGQTNWEVFRNEFNKDLEGLGEAIKNFGVPAKK